MKKNLNITEKQIIDRLDSINLSLRQKKDLIDIIKDITASSGGGGGGGTSTDKDALYIYVDVGTRTMIFNDKVFVSDNTEDSSIIIHDKELYSILYSSLVNNNVLLCIKSISTNKVQFSGTSSWIADAEKIEATLLFLGDGVAILVYNQ